MEILMKGRSIWIRDMDMEAFIMLVEIIIVDSG
jgi:hypothetical protein